MAASKISIMSTMSSVRTISSDIMHPHGKGEITDLKREVSCARMVGEPKYVFV